MAKQRSLYGFRHPKKAAFLDAYRRTGNITLSCRACGIERSLYYYWTEHDERFTMAARQAEAEAIELLEGEARRRAVSGVTRTKPIFYQGEECGQEVITEYSDTLLIFLLKGLKPDKYRETIRQEHTGPNGGAIEIREVVVELPEESSVE